MALKKIALYFLLISLIGILWLFIQHKEKKVATKLPKTDKVVVIKSKREMQLWRKGKILKSYEIALGGKPIGHKQKEGDEKTPEGNYILDWRNPKSSCYKSIHISYPNTKDIERAQKQNVDPGGNVMIHGLHPSIKMLGSKHKLYDWTDGCIGVTNEEMEEIWSSVANGTPIEIRK